MDPLPSLQISGCRNLSEFCFIMQPNLLHFVPSLLRALLLPLTSHKSKTICSALQTLTSVLKCGAWKTTTDAMEILVGFRDPNSVAIKEFYEPSNKINYLAILINHNKRIVREGFIRRVGEWCMELEDRWDHHPRLVPYLLSGVFDEEEEVREAAWEVVEEYGEMYEKEKVNSNSLNKF